jgi:serine/threonine protein kinase
VTDPRRGLRCRPRRMIHHNPVSTAAGQLQAGRRGSAVQIGKYDVIGQVGAGSTGVVWLATQPEVDRPVAIKQLAADLATDTSFRDRFRAEAQVLASLSTPNVVAVYDYVEAPDGAYIVEEYVDGASLARVVAEAGRLSPEQAVGVTRGALRGLADAHDVDLVHGDVTPANILVAQDGTSKLIDFGLSVSSGSTGSSGTPAYASPEAITGRPLDARSDVYSAGCVLFELLAGEAPFSGGTPAEIAARHAAAEPPALPGAHTGLAHVVGRAMANDPAARYPNAREFLAALEDQAQHDLGASWELTASIAGLALAAALTTTAVTGASAAARHPRSQRLPARVAPWQRPRREGYVEARRNGRSPALPPPRSPSW